MIEEGAKGKERWRKYEEKEREPRSRIKTKRKKGEKEE
jgi:hypothetical protein